MTDHPRRVTRAFAFDNKEHEQEYVLVETRNDLAPILRTVTKDTSFTRSTITGLAVWQRPDVTLARVGPRTLAVGSKRQGRRQQTPPRG